MSMEASQNHPASQPPAGAQAHSVPATPHGGAGDTSSDTLFIATSPGGSIMYLADSATNPNIAHGNELPDPKKFDPSFCITAKGWYYSVTRATVPGLYGDWADCQPLVIGISESSYQKFPTFHEAAAHFKIQLDKGQVAVLPPKRGASVGFSHSATSTPSSTVASPSHSSPPSMPATPVREHRGTPSSPISIAGTPSPAPQRVDDDFSPIILTMRALEREDPATPRAHNSGFPRGGPDLDGSQDSPATGGAHAAPFVSQSLLSLFHANVPNPATPSQHNAPAAVTPQGVFAGHAASAGAAAVSPPGTGMGGSLLASPFAPAGGSGSPVAAGGARAANADEDYGLEEFERFLATPGALAALDDTLRMLYARWKRSD